ncbi:stabilizer of axonemal microtubules 1-like [Bolinopsis microptera]|uniref:stabilizer of axonemal microtubules 1-like n=1 Tax=Bolinopsis microptera TaxID=2820187 RepID=UPI003079F1D6
MKVKVKDKCQCNLCDCGKHKCQLHGKKIEKYIPLPGNPENFKTHYQLEFKEKPGHQPPKPCLPVLIKQAPSPEKHPFEGSTESQEAFHQKALPLKFRKEKEKYEKPEGCMALLTTKSADYTAKPFIKQKSYKPNLKADRPKQLPQFEGETTSAAFYKAYEGCERQKMYSEHPVNLTLNTDKFEGVTTARHSYPAYRGNSRTLPIKPVEKEFESGLQFYGVTTNHDNYKGVQGAGAMQPIIHPSTYKQPTGEFYTETTTKAHYSNKALSASLRSHPIIPQEIREPLADFNGKTTNSETYPAHPPQDRPKPREKEKYNKPTEKMDITSVHRDIYKPHSVQRRRKLTPLDPVVRKSSAPVPKFQGRTTHKEQFKRWTIEKQKAFSEPPRLLKVGIGTMETRTMQQRDFVYDGAKVDRAKPIIPQVKVIRSDLPLDCLTSYMLEFKGLQNKCRLAEMLVSQAEHKLSA